MKKLKYSCRYIHILSEDNVTIFLPFRTISKNLIVLLYYIIYDDYATF